MLSEADRDSDGFPIIGELGGSPLNATANNPTGGARWDDPVTEDPKVGATEIWNLVNITTDGHPIHIHLVQFQVLNRQPFGGPARGPEAWEHGWKDTVVALPGEITRLKARFDRAGRYVWHCHIIDHEDHEMMRPYRIG